MTTARAFGVAVASALAVTGGCADDDLTELIVQVDTDFVVPDELDGIRIDIIGPGGEVRQTNGPVNSTRRLPVYVGLVHRDGPTEPIQITVAGTKGGEEVIQRRARARFTQDRVRVLRLFLSRECLEVMCDPPLTCDFGECIDAIVDPDEYGEWTGPPDRFDAMPPGRDAGGDAGPDACVPAGETCNGADDDCDGATDEGFDFDRDPSNCGGCGTVCDADPLNGSGVCIDGGCVVVCDSGWADCDETEAGCEALLSSTTSCGGCGNECESANPFCSDAAGAGFECLSTCTAPRTACGMSCIDTETSPAHCGACDTACPAPPRATAACAGGRCGFICDTGFHDCDATGDNGCESQLRELDNCGSCGAACAPANAVASCVGGACEIVTCDGTRQDCNTTVADGCEVDVGSDPANCGACGNACPENPANATAACVSGRCILRCDPGFANCDGDVATGCEASLSAAATCGSCGIRCDGATPRCADGSCVADCGGATDCAGSCTDTATDPLHCGACGNACAEPPGASRTCDGAVCGFRCDTGRESCDGDATNGCEAIVGSLAHCGGCNMPCAPRNGIGVCVTGACAIARCSSGFADCDGDPASCEIDIDGDAANCGACDNDCSALPGVSGVGCSGGACRIDSCEAGRGDCDDDASTGCETDTQTTAEHCGSCDNDCGGGTCASGSCT